MTYFISQHGPTHIERPFSLKSGPARWMFIVGQCEPVLLPGHPSGALSRGWFQASSEFLALRLRLHLTSCRNEDEAKRHPTRAPLQEYNAHYSSLLEWLGFLKHDVPFRLLSHCSALFTSANSEARLIVTIYWRQPTPTTTVRSPRSSHAPVYRLIKRRIVVAGGEQSDRLGTSSWRHMSASAGT